MGLRVFIVILVYYIVCFRIAISWTAYFEAVVPYRREAGA
jgi:hypothetical protein